MIVTMSKVYVVSRGGDRDRLLNALRDLGVVHLAPVDPARAVAEEQTLATITNLGRAMQILTGIEPAGAAPELSAIEAAAQALRIQRGSAERKSRLAALHRQFEQLAAWGETSLDQFVQLCEAGIDVKFFVIPAEELAQVRAECVQVLGERPGKRLLVAVIDRRGEFEPPESAVPVELPARDRPTIRAEAAKIDSGLKKDAERLSQLAHLAEAMRREREQLRQKADYTVAKRGGLAEAELFALQGWVPADEAGALRDRLADAGIPTAVHEMPPPPGEQPPTLIRYPRWARPIKGLFDILATLPGYKEFDLSGFFMVALPLFAAMIIGDAGYGLILLGVSLLAYRKLVSFAGKAKIDLLMVVGAVTLVWGILTANYFGVTPGDLMKWGGFNSVQAMRQGRGFLAALGRVTCSLGLLWRPSEEAARFLIIKVSFIIGSVHLILAHVRRAIGYWPNAKAWSEVGWCGVLAGMLGVIWRLFGSAMPAWFAVSARAFQAAIISLVAGYAMAVFFAYPGRSIGKRIGLGFASSLLPMIATFSDTMSYIRLMAVGLASYYIAASFNGLGAMISRQSAWLWLAGAPIILFGHMLNIALAGIAILAHGVRLNMLEFSSNAGVRWAGYAYEPFSRHQIKEI